MLFLPILVPFAAGILMFYIKNDRIRQTAVPIAALLTVLSTLLTVFSPRETIPFVILGDHLVLCFGNDPAACFFMLLIALIGAFTAVYSLEYIRRKNGAPFFFGFYFLTLAALIALAEAQSLITVYMCFELMSFLSMPLVLHNRSKDSRDAAMRYIGYSAFGASLFLFGWFLSAEYLTGSIFTAGGIAFHKGGEDILVTAFFLMVLGFGSKIGLLPLQGWLPVTHPEAPAPASALLSGLVTKGGIIAILRVIYFVFGPSFVRETWAQTVLLILSLCTIFTGSVMALRTQALKKRLAYSSVSQISYVLFGLLLLNEAGFSGAFLQIFFHAFAKAVLFLAAGAIIHNLNLTETKQLKGIGKRMPVTMLCFTAASLSLIGIPPAGGFIAKWYLAEGALAGNDPLMLAGVIVLLISAILTAFYLFELISDAFFPGRYAEVGKKSEVGIRMHLPMIVFSVVILAVGFFPNPLLDLIRTITQGLF